MTAISRLTRALADRYPIERELGRGGMATVYLARDLRHDRQVALKLLDPDLGAVLGTQRFLSEIRVTANLQHPNILPLFDSGEFEGMLYYVMPFVDGESLGARLAREKQLPIDEALRISVAVASALDYAHRRQVIHRDLKPDNILLLDGQPLVADFGIALALSRAAGERMTQTGLSVGTPMYMSPEQAAGERDIDGRSDIYALGAVTYEMLVGEPPHTGASAQAILAKIMTDSPRRLRLGRPLVAEHVEAALDRALAKVPADRYATAQEFAAALSQPAPTSTRGATSLKGRRSGRRLAVAAGLALAFAGVAIALHTWVDPHPPTAVPRFFTVALPDSAPFVPGRDAVDASARALAISNDGRRIVYSAAIGAGTQLMHIRLDQGTITPLRNTGNATLPALSPDGHAIAFQSPTGLRRVSLDDATVTSLGDNGWISGLLWDDEQTIFAASYQECIRVVPAAGGRVIRALGSHCAAGHLSSIPGSDWMLADAAGVMIAVSRTSGATRALRVTGPASDSTAGVSAAGFSPFLVTRGILAYVHDSTLYAARFDESTLHIVGEPHAILTNVRSEPFGQHVVLAADGTLVWVRGHDGARARFVWVTRDGIRRDSLFLGRALVTSYALSSDGHRLAFSTRSATDAPRLSIASIDRQVVDDVPTSVELHPINWIDHDRKLVVMMLLPNAEQRQAVVSWTGGVPSIDTSGVRFDDESGDGLRRCASGARDGVYVWNTALPDRRTRLQAGGGTWCRFSPDGQRVAWVANGGGLFVAQADSTGPTSRVLLASEGADEPRWSSDGRRIVFRNAHRWYETALPTNGAIAPTAPRLLFTGHFLQAYSSWALSADGRFLLLAEQEELPVRNLNVLTNFPLFVQERLKVQK